VDKRSGAGEGREGITRSDTTLSGPDGQDSALPEKGKKGSSGGSDLHS
jgi:hypothetical protein